MKKFIYYLTIIACLFFVACSDGNKEKEAGANNESISDANRKYDIKSAIVTFETSVETPEIKTKGKKILYFDDYGMKECEETYEDNKLTISFFSNGVDLYNLSFESKIAYKTDSAYGGTALRFDWDKIPKDEKDAGNAKIGTNESIAGKDCQVFTVFNKNTGTTTKYAGWNHICLLTDLSSNAMKSIYKAEKIEENVSIPEEKFIVPDGFKIQK